MLTETIQSSISALKRKEQLTKDKAAAAQLHKNLAKLNVCVTQTQETLDCAEEMKACHISEVPIFTGAVRDELREAVNDCGNAIHEGALNADKVQLLEFHAKAAKRELDDSWSQYAPTLVDPLKSRLAILRSLSADGQRIQKLETSMQAAFTNPVTKEHIRSFAQDVAEAKQITDKFPLDAEIEDFLQKVSQRRATLADLTPEVLLWLRKYQFLRKFRIVSL